MQAIVTKYLPATDTKDSRIKATCEAGSITISYLHRYNAQEAHASAAMALVRKLGWNESNYNENWIGGALPGSHSVFVFVNSNSDDSFTHQFGA